MEKYMQSKTPNKNSECLDYNNVFGGPPRRISFQEVRVRRRLSDLLATEHGGTPSSPSMPKEKLMFREARVTRRPNLSDNFFDDIFRGDESYSSPMRTHHEWENLFGSRISNPAVRAEHFGTSLPTQSSREDSSSTATSDPKDNVESSKKNTNAMESPTSGDRFHFSIYKWAGRGVPLLRLHIERSTVKELSTNDRFPSSGRKIEGESTRKESLKVMMNQDLSANIVPDSLRPECEEKENNEVNLNAALGKEQECENLNKDEARVETPSFQKSFIWESKTLENSSDLFEDFFLFQELSDDNENVTRSEEACDETKALDTKILQWSVLKKGNIHSLLANLQFVSSVRYIPQIIIVVSVPNISHTGSLAWKPIPLVDLIEVNAVKRTYQKALLRIHPDKLQQINAASHHKYIAEKVFDILQEAWDQFNALAPL